MTKKWQENRKNEGITLIALIITIIVLLILAGITLTLTFVNNGILSKTQIAKDEHIKQEATETMNLKITEIQLKSYGENKSLATLQYLADKLCEDQDMEYVIKKEKEQASLKKIDVSNVSSIFTKIKKYPYEFEINSSLQLASIDGISLAGNPNNSDEINELKKIIEEQNTKIDDLNTQISNLIKKDTELNTQLSSLDQKNTQLSTQLEALKTNTNQIQSSTFSITNGRIKGSKNYLRQIGKVVSIEIAGDSGSQNITANSTVLVATGLPPSSLPIQELTITLDDTSAYARCWVNSSGNLYICTSANNYTKNIFIGGTYICQ